MSENENHALEQELYVEDAKGERHLYGEGTKRVKFYDKDNNQITKSCHVCQNQHFKFKCQYSETCSYSFCSTCLERYHADLKMHDAIQRCPVCRGVCSCRSCLRKMHLPDLMKGQNEERAIENAEHILTCCGPVIRQTMEQYDRAVAEAGWKLEDVPFDRPDGDFVTCDLCCTSIPDLHFTQPTTDDSTIDICVECADELKEKEATRSGLDVPEPSKIMPARLMSVDMLRTMRRIAAAYGNSKDRPVKPLFEYPDTDEPIIEADIAVSKDSSHIKLQFVVKRPDHTDDYIKDMNRNAQRRSRKLERQIKALESKMHWRDAGHGQRVRCIDASVCRDEDVDRLLSLCIWKGEPLIIQNVRGIMDWRPQTMTRVFVDRRGLGSFKRSKRSGRSRLRDTSSDEDRNDVVHQNDVCVIRCNKNGEMEYWKQSAFFNLYENGSDDEMCKIKDWPPDDSFSDKLARHYQDFVEMLPFPVYTNPISGALNLTTALPEYRCRPDIGPKTYIATGRTKEYNDGTDSVTAMHLDMTDAVNILLHSQQKQPTDAATPGAVWTIVARKDVATVTEYLRRPDAICKKKHYLKEEDRSKLIRDHDVQMWNIQQFQNDAIYVPSGCPHQVRNTRSSLKVAVDFFPPESAFIVKDLVQYQRQFAKRVRRDETLDVADKLQGMATIMYACREAYNIIKKQKTDFSVVTKTQRKWKDVEMGNVSGDEDDMDIDQEN